MVRVETEECVGCESCVPVCPVGAITMQDGKAVIDQGTCTECQACVATCPVEAIKVE
ncbi:MAG: 4Fe-4S binding protein [Planctomycetes bacterium]|nr:4Fe-4S binding protein [Planctomycetota bacterium]